MKAHSSMLFVIIGASAVALGLLFGLALLDIHWEDYPEVGWFALAFIVVAVGIHAAKAQMRSTLQTKGRFRRF